MPDQAVVHHTQKEGPASAGPSSPVSNTAIGVQRFHAQTERVQTSPAPNGAAHQAQGPTPPMRSTVVRSTQPSAGPSPLETGNVKSGPT